MLSRIQELKGAQAQLLKCEAWLEKVGMKSPLKETREKIADAIEKEAA